ncbi:MAG: 16S rRNA (cytidine(1402)-2'-O)-methyltransferase [bacterium]|nr:16S rRNA (cytidine(1402)-2'-O)-methyltransferase [bacterium]
MSDKPALYIVATPIGNLDDFSFRAVKILGEVDVLACEDTRRTKILLSKFEIRQPSRMISYREKNEVTAVQGIIKLLENGNTVALCTDAGYPGLSDPGYRLISAAVEKGIEVIVIPGASAVDVALASSGLPTDSFTFLGFPPRKDGQRLRFFETEKDSSHTLIFFESPMRVVETLLSALEALGDRKTAVCIELTKIFERIHRGYLSDLIEELRDIKIKGEVTIVIAGNNRKFLKDSDS